MEDLEVPIEKVQEDIHEAVHQHAHGGSESNSSFLNRAAITSAILAVLAAISALFGGHYANDAMIEQIKSSDQWAYYQAKGIKRSISELKAQNTHADDDLAKVEAYKRDQENIKDKAEEKERESERHLLQHESLAASVTFFQVAIGLTAIAVLARKKSFLWGSMALGICGLFFMVRGLLNI